jgi:hypothetical protein
MVSRWYGKMFGQKALDDRNPFGMKRLVTYSSYSYPKLTFECKCQWPTYSARMHARLAGSARLYCCKLLHFRTSEWQGCIAGCR